MSEVSYVSSAPAGFGQNTLYAPKVTVTKTTEDWIADVCDEIKALLIEKNRKYGNSALEPVRIFSKAPTDEQLRVRLDDKLSRLARGSVDLEDEDVLLDLLGYMVMLIIHGKNNE